MGINSRYPPGTAIPPEDRVRWETVDRENTAFLKWLVAEQGWPKESVFGVDGASAAWLLVQHADHDREFQRQCLELLREAVATGEGAARNLAYLEDRVRINAGQPQIYGTQMILVDGVHIPAPMEDAERVDERRAAVGLGPLTEYVAQFQHGPGHSC